jgi:hypothetical protein
MVPASRCRHPAGPTTCSARMYFTVAEVARRGDPADRNHPEIGEMSEGRVKRYGFHKLAGATVRTMRGRPPRPCQFGSSSLTERSG